MQPTSGVPISPLLPWPGGKYWLGRALREAWPWHRRRIVEPFCGGAGFSMAICPQRAHVNDFHEPVVQALQALAEGAIQSIDAVTGPEEFRTAVDAWNVGRSRDTSHTSDELEGLVRVFRSGRFWEWRGNGGIDARYRQASKAVTAGVLADLTRPMAGWTFQSEQWFEVQAAPDDVLFVDPPYVDSRGVPTSAFSWEEHVAVARWVARSNVPALLTHRFVPSVVGMYQAEGLRVCRLRRPAPGAGSTRELVAVNEAATDFAHVVDKRVG